MNNLLEDHFQLHRRLNCFFGASFFLAHSQVKIEKEPMKLVIERGIEELAKTPIEEIDKSKLTKDDIDVRLKWLGLFHRRKHQCN